MDCKSAIFALCFVLFATVWQGVGAKKRNRRPPSKKKVDDLGLGATAPILVCTACTRVIGRVGVDVTKRLERNEKWSKELRLKYKHMLKVACANKEDFPPENDIFLKGCAVFMSQHHKACLKKIKKHLDPDAEEYEEDIVEKEFCTEIGACMRGMQNIDDHLNSPPPSKIREQDRRPPPRMHPEDNL